MSIVGVYMANEKIEEQGPNMLCNWKERMPGEDLFVLLDDAPVWLLTCLHMLADSPALLTCHPVSSMALHLTAADRSRTTRERR